MKPIPKILFLLLPIVILGWGLAAEAKQANVYTMSGRIAAINLEADTVVVEVPVKNDNLMTVGGPLVEDATLNKNGRDTDLKDFAVGDQVQVTWEKTDETLLIKKITAR